MIMFTSNETITKYNKANQTIPQLSFNIDHIETHLSTAAVKQSVVAFALHAESGVFESQLWQTFKSRLMVNNSRVALPKIDIQS